MSNKVIIIKFLQENEKQFCDDCLSIKLQIKPRQQINMICNRLKDEETIIRERSKCFRCNMIKLTNRSSKRIKPFAIQLKRTKN